MSIVIRGRCAAGAAWLERIGHDTGHRVPDDFEEVQFSAGGRKLDDQIVTAAGHGHRGAGHDGVRFRGIERVVDGGGPVELAWPQCGGGRVEAGCHVRVVVRLDVDDPLRAVSLLGGDEPGRVGVLLDEEPLVQSVDGQVYFAEDEQEVAALHLGGRGRGDHDVR